MFIDIDDNDRLTIDSDIIVCSHHDDLVAGHLIACYMNAERKLIPVHPYEISWDGESGTLDFSGRVDAWCWRRTCIPDRM